MHLIRFLLHYINTVYLKFYEVFFPYYKWLPDEAFCTDFYVCFQEKASSCFQGPHQLEVPCIIQPCTEQNHLSYTFLWNQTYLWLLKLYIIVGKTIYSDKQANRCGIFEKKNMFKVESNFKLLRKFGWMIKTINMANRALYSAHSCLWPILLILVQERKEVDVLSAEYELGPYSCALPSLGRRNSLSKSRQMEGVQNSPDKSYSLPALWYSVCFHIFLHLKYINFPLFCTFRTSSSYNFETCNSIELHI